MATGDVKWFRQALLDLGLKKHNLSSDSIQLGIVTNATVPSTTTADPRWGAGGTTNFSTNQVGVGGTQYTGPKTLTTVSWALQSNVPTFRADIISMTIDPSGFTNGAYGIIFNNTSAGKEALAFVEISSGGTASLQAGPISIDWNGATNDILTITQA